MVFRSGRRHEGAKALSGLLQAWGVPDSPGYADNSRETLRDETFRKWREHGALRERQDLPKTSGAGRWTMESHFADLFDPTLSDSEVRLAADEWREAHLSPAAKLRVRFAIEGEQASHAVTVALPNNAGTRILEVGRASLILKGVIESWAPARLRNPYVVSVSEPGDKLFTADATLLSYLGVTINVSSVLPDALIADVGENAVDFWFVEAVNTDGEINEARKRSFLKWAREQGIETERCRFLTAFSSRNDPAARKRLKDLADGSYAYFADEPGHELAWYAIASNVGGFARFETRATAMRVTM
ncbi:BsuBI/PstI family type II restriction endonuclease [Galbitalea sp. SE-J8]|uniref:BsuBI/PstI family type II restriction endonuclease n=1 Tax=Galbitalea sp. SE-J8 TaxID=3054952 RepID=UPI00259C9EF9|nr:BsuBI/PstI family type II restriction endonuclease [Galbitalea sp. SE-J8]MDM4764324.1 BsuBI/PstI family type II restriction endonuclease [Galbitalea sp. SE-J8]